MRKQVHEENISAHLGRCTYGGGLHIGKTLVLLGFVNRSGSNHLGDLISRQDGFSGFKEQLNHPQVLATCRRYGIETFPDYIYHIATRRSGQSFGVKASADQVRMLHRWRLFEMFSETKMIHVIRNDIIAQAVSLHVAQQTGQWSSRQSDGYDPVAPYDFDRIRRRVDAINRRNGDLRLVGSAP